MQTMAQVGTPMYGGVDAVWAFIQNLLQKFYPKNYVNFEW
jgi:hypothetical protein